MPIDDLKLIEGFCSKGRAEDLPEEQARLLVVHALHCANQGPPIHAALGIDEYSARKRLVRAQAAMQRLLESEEANG